jgi:signal transduction histidine kinase/putative methionine-R-sulfoxide reductase with GAF domain
MADATLLLVGEDRNTLDRIGAALARTGHDYRIASPREGIESLRTGEYDIVLVTLDSLGDRGIVLMRDLTATGKNCRYLVVTDRHTRPEEIYSLGSSVWSCFEEPVETDDLLAAVDRIEEFIHLQREVAEQQKKLSRLEILNEITRETLLSRDSDSLLRYLAQFIHDKLAFPRIGIFLMNPNGDRLVLKTFEGVNPGDFPPDYGIAIGEGIAGRVAEKLQCILIGDTRTDPLAAGRAPHEERMLSVLAVPVIFEDRILGVIEAGSDETNAFSNDDRIVLRTVADQIAMSSEKARLTRELIEAHQLSEAINDSLPVSIIIADRGLRIEWMNRTFLEMSMRKSEDWIGRPVLDLFPGDFSAKLAADRDLETVLATGVPITHSNIRYTSFEHQERVITVSFFHVLVGETPRVMVLIQDVTDFTKKAYQLSLLRKISIAMQGVLERDKLLHLILTCVTAGFAIGFNRAFLFLANRDGSELHGIMGVGPTSQEDAYTIWSELSRKALTFDEYLADANRGVIVRGGLQNLVENIVIRLPDTTNILTATSRNGTVIHVTNAREHPLMDETMRKLIISDEFVAVPLIVKNTVIGVLLADNAFSGTPITGDSIEVLTMFTSQAAIAIENAQILGDLEEKVHELEEAYRNLEKAQDMIIRNEKLAAIGEVSARLAHEIRNPLSTIGGFAKSIQKRYGDRERTIRNANIIVEEIHRLEHILSNVLDFTKTGAPKKTLGDINRLIRETLATMEGNIASNGVVVVLDISEGPLELNYDEAQIKQVIINLIQNAINAMPEGGALEIKTVSGEQDVRIEIRDTGVGIPPQHLDNIFEPFFTTRGNGTGLGLSISHRIVQNHGGKLDITSKEGKGTTVTIVLPKNPDGFPSRQ